MIGTATLTCGFTIWDDEYEPVTFSPGLPVQVLAVAYENIGRRDALNGKVYVIYSPELRTATTVHEFGLTDFRPIRPTLADRIRRVAETMYTEDHETIYDNLIAIARQLEDAAGIVRKEDE